MCVCVFTSEAKHIQYEPQCFNGQCNLHDQSTNVIERQWFEYPMKRLALNQLDLRAKISSRTRHHSIICRIPWIHVYFRLVVLIKDEPFFLRFEQTLRIHLCHHKYFCFGIYDKSSRRMFRNIRNQNCCVQNVLQPIPRHTQAQCTLQFLFYFSFGEKSPWNSNNCLLRFMCTRFAISRMFSFTFLRLNCSAAHFHMIDNTVS